MLHNHSHGGILLQVKLTRQIAEKIVISAQVHVYPLK